MTTSHDDPSELTVQPGAIYMPGPFVPNGLDPHTDLTHPDWPKLPGYEAANFVSAEPYLLPANAGSTRALCRVWGEPAWDLGHYWTETAPDTEERFYADLAVVWHWNSGLYVANLVTTGGSQTAIKAWRGPASRQPADALDAEGRYVPAPGYVVEGGAMQYYIPNGVLPYVYDEHTAWNPAAAPALAAQPVHIQPVPASRLPAALDAGRYLQLLNALERLVGLLQGLGAGLAGNGGLAAARAANLNLAARRLLDTAAFLNSNLADASEESQAPARLALWSLVATGRHLDGDLSFTGQADAIDAAIKDVVLLAHALATSKG